MTLTLALSYGSREELSEATRKIAVDYKEGKISLEEINQQSISNHLYTKDMPDPNLRFAPVANIESVISYCGS